MKRLRAGFVLVAAFALVACGASPPAPDWQQNASLALQAFQRLYFAGETSAAEAEFRRARSELARTGRPELVARAELVRCAARAASLEFDECPRFEALRAAARPEELAYKDYLDGKGAHARADEPFSRLVAAAVELRKGAIEPSAIAASVELASEQGWRRPLLAWLGVQLKRAESAGEADAATRIRRRMDLVSG